MSQDLVRTSTLKLDESEGWAKLTSLSSGLSDYTLKELNITIGRNPTCSIQINDRRLSGKHCQIVKGEGDKITILDLSTNGTFLKD